MPAAGKRRIHILGGLSRPRCTFGGDTLVLHSLLQVPIGYSPKVVRGGGATEGMESVPVAPIGVLINSAELGTTVL